MPVNGPSYPRQKFAEAVETLAAGDEPLIKRIEYACSSIIAVDERDFPDDDLGSEYKELVAQLNSEPDTRGEGTLPATLRVMTPEKARDIAERFVSLAFSLAKRHP